MGFKDIGIRKPKFVANTQFLSIQFSNFNGGLLHLHAKKELNKFIANKI